MAYKHNATEPFGEQADNTIRVNFIDTLNVCESLFPLLRKHARVVNVSSSAGHLQKINGAEPGRSELQKRFSAADATQEQIVQLANEFVTLAKQGTHFEAGWPNSTYVVSKVAVSALTIIQQRKFDENPEKDIVVNSVHPGYVDTDMTSHKGELTIDEGCQAPVYLALLPPNVKEPRGGYVWCDKRTIDWIKQY
jgi:carbonyl reductase 1